MRSENRQFDELRKVEIIPDINLYAEGSCLIKCGQTQVICTASVDEKTPLWLTGQDKGWITAEYALLPRSTQTRCSRETRGAGGRTHEIQRLIGRSLRAVVDLSVLKGFSILIDCDVIQADGGTRTASITGSFVALYIALEKMVKEQKIPYNPIREHAAAISAGIYNDVVLLDLDYSEDSKAQTDANFVLTESGKIIEIQATAEGNPFLKKDYDTLFALAYKGIQQLILIQKEAIKYAKI
ncbi:MAG: ribonuclease PH [Alphaproteobacteria bacterium]|nr:ribonuclease PH [Alphaproteobacteria bacterium]